MKTITVENLVIGEGVPEIIALLMGKDIATVRNEAPVYRKADFDILEWRVDHFTDVFSTEAVLEAARAIRDAMVDRPLFFIFRSAKEGSKQVLSVKYYAALDRVAVDNGLVDMIGPELFTSDELVKAIVKYVYAENVFVIISNHDFHKIPATGEIAQHLRKMQELGTDIPRIALAPQNKTDVLTLLSAMLEIQERCANRPIITMSMAKAGMISRLSGEVFDSMATLGIVKKVSTLG